MLKGQLNKTAWIVVHFKDFAVVFWNPGAGRTLALPGSALVKHNR